ncbi:MAG: tetratricopeptide repeat protein [Terracidiphilus sp.]
MQGSNARKMFHASLLVSFFTLIPLRAGASQEDFGKAIAAMQAGEADAALALLQSASPSAEAHNLRCRVYFSLEQWEAAETECQQAVNLEGQNSDYHMWLGRALGEKADQASFMSAFSLAKRTRIEFEEAVRLNPQNAPAMADLGEFYYEAPGVVGGGAAKADEVAIQLDPVDQPRAHELRGRTAESRKDFVTAERELKEAIAASKHPAFQWMTLASFYRRHERWNEMNAALHTGIRAAQSDHQATAALFNGASMLAKSKMDLDLAAQMFREYLASPVKNEDAPAFVARVRLARLEAATGDLEGARRERAAALELAHSYRPALELKF